MVFIPELITGIIGPPLGAVQDTAANDQPSRMSRAYTRRPLLEHLLRVVVRATSTRSCCGFSAVDREVRCVPFPEHCTGQQHASMPSIAGYRPAGIAGERP